MSQVESDASSNTKETLSTENGRVQTPELTVSPVVHRHHLDVTTPNRHGMLLSSPPHRNAPIRDQNEDRRGIRNSGKNLIFMCLTLQCVFKCLKIDFDGNKIGLILSCTCLFLCFRRKILQVNFL